EAQSFEKIVLHRLEVHERRYFCRVITCKMELNGFLFKIKRSVSLDCKWCENKKETVEHFLMECPHYQGLRDSWRAAIKKLLPHFQFNTSNLSKNYFSFVLFSAMSCFGPGAFSTCFCLGMRKGAKNSDEWRMKQGIPFDKNKSRPKSHFKQCRNCYRLNHIARECPKKYCGLVNHEAAKCRNKNDPRNTNVSSVVSSIQ
ncbi:hypothetical protein RFI_38528, partial [Reticulomyxa filosa]